MSLEIQNLSVDRGRRRIVSNISLNIKPGELVVIVEPNGAGKSTLLAAVSGEHKPISCQMLMDQKCLKS